MEDDFRPQTLVRRFSEQIAIKVESGNAKSTLERIVAEDFREAEKQENADAQWRKYFEPWGPVTVKDFHLYALKSEAKKLSEVWKTFRERLPVEEQARFEQRAPSFTDVIDTMKSVQDRWDEKRKKGKLGAVSTFYKKCCVNIKSHETMLKILPEDNEYCSLFTGVLKSIVYATANHEKIAVALSKAIEEINQTVDRCHEALELYNTEKIQGLLMNLYFYVFTFLRDVLEWYLDKRLKRVFKSFNEDLYGYFQDQLKDISKQADFIRGDAMMQGQSAEIRSTRITSEEVLRQIRAEHEAAQRDREIQERKALAREAEQEARQARFERALFERLATGANSLLLDQAEHACDRHRYRLLSPDIGARSRSLSADRLPLAVEAISQVLSRDATLKASRDLESYFDRDRVRIQFDPTNIGIPEEASSAIRQWMNLKRSALLSIAGEESFHSLEPSGMSKLAGSMVELADAAKIPVMSYFCQLQRPSSHARNVTLQSRAIVALIYALIRQVIELWPTEAETTADFTADRFQTLDGSLGSSQEAIQVLESALQYAPPMFYCIIDGFQWLDDRSTAKVLGAFLKLLRRHTKSDSKPKMLFKVLITTSGRSRCLLRHLPREELILADEAGSDLRENGMDQSVFSG